MDFRRWQYCSVRVAVEQPEVDIVSAGLEHASTSNVRPLSQERVGVVSFIINHIPLILCGIPETQCRPSIVGIVPYHAMNHYPAQWHRYIQVHLKSPGYERRTTKVHLHCRGRFSHPLRGISNVSLAWCRRTSFWSVLYASLHLYYLLPAGPTFSLLVRCLLLSTQQLFAVWGRR